jgi:hypothetical protein
MKEFIKELSGYGIITGATFLFLWVIFSIQSLILFGMYCLWVPIPLDYVLIVKLSSLWALCGLIILILNMRG